MLIISMFHGVPGDPRGKMERYPGYNIIIRKIIFVILSASEESSISDIGDG